MERVNKMKNKEKLIVLAAIRAVLDELESHSKEEDVSTANS